MAAEPVSAFVVKKAIDTALVNVERLLKEADDLQRSEVQRCTSFLEACSEIILGLEREYDEILVQTEKCADAPAAIEQLRQRIKDYLHVDKLLWKLGDAIEGLSFYQSIFEKRAASLLDWLWKWAGKDEAVMKFAGNLEKLNEYLKKLRNEDLPHRPAGTGVGQKALHAILKNMDTPPAFRTSSLKELGTLYLAERNKEPLYERVKQIRDATESMRHAFL